MLDSVATGIALCGEILLKSPDTFNAHSASKMNTPLKPLDIEISLAALIAFLSSNLLRIYACHFGIIFSAKQVLDGKWRTISMSCTQSFKKVFGGGATGFHL